MDESGMEGCASLPTAHHHPPPSARLQQGTSNFAAAAAAGSSSPASFGVINDTNYKRLSNRGVAEVRGAARRLLACMATRRAAGCRC